MKEDHESLISRHWFDTISRFKSSPSEVKVWWALPFMNLWINERITGRQDYYYWNWFKDNYIDRPLERGLSLGCGDGTSERILYQLGVCNYFDGFDISQNLIAEAEKKADEIARGHIRYFHADLNNIDFAGENLYQLVVAKDILHHIENLESLIENIRKALQPDGLFLAYEYIGPNRFAMDKETFRAAKEVYDFLPLRYRLQIPQDPTKRLGKCLLHWFPCHRFKYRIREFAISDPEEVARPDPSEAVRSEDIIPLIQKNFEILHTAFWGNTIFPAIYNLIADNIDPSKAKDVKILRYIWDLEKEKLEAGEIVSNHVLMVLRNRR